MLFRKDAAGPMSASICRLSAWSTTFGQVVSSASGPRTWLGGAAPASDEPPQGMSLNWLHPCDGVRYPI